jgi:ubiquinone/menaquinone biosynthesis C-methylase UbiE
MKALERSPEDKQTYHESSAVAAYIAASQRLLFSRIERLYVRQILARWGRHPLQLHILDIGTGPGWIPVILKKARPDWRVTALDASDLMLEKAKTYADARGIEIQWLNAYAENTGLSPNQFDLVLSHFSLHEFTDPVAVLYEMVRVTKNGGAILMQDWERPVGWRMPLAILLVKLFYLFSPHMRRQAIESIQAAYTAQEVKTFLQKSPLTFEITSFWYSFCKLIKVTAIRP